MQLPELDWKIAALAMLAAITAYNIVLKVYTADVSSGKEDVRAFAPALIIIGVLALGFHLYAGQGVKFSEKTPAYIVLIIGIVGVTAYLTLQAFKGPVSVVAPIVGLAAAASAVIGIFALGEAFTPLKGLGVLLGLVSIYLVMAG